ncbi:hypothetical protein NOGI109294_27295 [Nocardiopsis gilva]
MLRLGRSHAAQGGGVGGQLHQRPGAGVVGQLGVVGLVGAAAGAVLPGGGVGVVADEEVGAAVEGDAGLAGFVEHALVDDGDAGGHGRGGGLGGGRHGGVGGFGVVDLHDALAEHLAQPVEFGLFVGGAAAGDQRVDLGGGGDAVDAGGQRGFERAAVVALHGVDQVGG